jgi:hypothetical protein
LLVAWLAQASGRSSATMPQPSSATRIRSVPHGTPPRRCACWRRPRRSPAALPDVVEDVPQSSSTKGCLKQCLFAAQVLRKFLQWQGRPREWTPPLHRPIQPRRRTQDDPGYPLRPVRRLHLGSIGAAHSRLCPPLAQLSSSVQFTEPTSNPSRRWGRGPSPTDTARSCGCTCPCCTGDAKRG